MGNVGVGGGFKDLDSSTEGLKGYDEDSKIGVGGPFEETEFLLLFLQNFFIPFMLITVDLLPVLLRLSLLPTLIVDDPDKLCAIETGISIWSLDESAEKRLDASLVRGAG